MSSTFSQLLYVSASCAVFYLVFIYTGLLKYLSICFKIRNIDGPQPLPIIGNIMQVIGPPEKIFLSMRHFIDLYAPTFSAYIGPYPSVNTVSPKDTELFMSTMKNHRKGPHYRFLHPWLGTGLLTSDGDKWRTRRKILTPAFHFSVLVEFVDIFNKHTERLIENIRSGDKDGFDVSDVISEYTLYAICDTAMGTSLSSLTEEEQKSYKSCVHNFGKLFVKRLFSPIHYIEPLYQCSSLGAKFRQVCSQLHKFSTQVIKERSEEYLKYRTEKQLNHDTQKKSLGFKKKKMAMLDVLLSAKYEEHSIDDVGIREEVDTFIFEGHDTTSASLCFTLMLLANNKDCQDKIYEEIRTVLPDLNDMPTYNELNEMKYLERCIKESLRLYPSVPHLSRISDGVTSTEGFPVPEGCMINLLVFDLHRREELWPDPLKFDPDRFLPENIASRHPFAYIPFSAGPRNCIGQKFAMLEMKSVLTAILKDFILEPVDTPKTVFIIPDLVLRPKDGIKVKFVNRTLSNK